MIKEKLELTKNTILNFDYNTFFKVKFKCNNELKIGFYFLINHFLYIQMILSIILKMLKLKKYTINLN